MVSVSYTHLDVYKRQVFFAMILWHRTPLLSMQLLLIHLATDSLPAIALGMELSLIHI